MSCLPYLKRSLGAFWLLVVLSAPCAAASYRVQLAATGNTELDQALRASSNLIALQASAPVGGFALITRAQGDLTRLPTALESQGYYEGQVAITVAGRDVGDTSLPEQLDQASQAAPIPVIIKITTGPLFHLRAVTLAGHVPADVRAKLAPLGAGAPAIAAGILAAQDRMLNALREDGYAFATVSAPLATENPGARTLDVGFTAVAGPKVRIGAITLSGLRGVEPGYVRRRLLVHQGDQFSPSAVENARQDLAATGLFTSVFAELGSTLDAGGELPLTFKFVEAKKHLVSLNVAYSTDLGGSAGVTWSDRNMLGAGQQLNLHADVTDLGGSDTNSPGYDVGAEWLIPDFSRRDQSLSYDVDAVRQYLVAYDSTGVSAGVTLKRKLSAHWSVSVGFTTTAEQVEQNGVTTDYELLAVPATLAFDNTDSAFDPTHGWRASVSLTPTYSFGRADVPYVIAQTTASTYFDLGVPGHSVLALRGLVGSADGASLLNLPPDQRFYGGGSATVRGYAYQSIGPRFPDGNPVGGLAIDAATIEFRQHLMGNFGGVVFVDGGQVSASTAPFVGEPRFGAGLGVRYSSAIGPIRLDLATPLNRQHGDSLLEVYIGIGQAF